MKKMKGFTIIELTVLLALVVSVFGWISNIVRITTGWIGFDDITITMILRLIGVVMAPLGIVMGFIPN